MAKTIQRGDVGEAVAGAFGVKGRVAPVLDETVALTSHLLDIERSPYRIPSACASWWSQAAVVANYAYVFVTPPVNALLVIWAVNVTRAAAGAVRVNLLGWDPAPGWTVLGSAQISSLQYNRGRYVAAQIHTAQHTLSLGDEVAVVEVPADTTWRQVFPVPIVLGRQPGGPGILAVRSGLVNEYVAASFEGDIYRMPG